MVSFFFSVFDTNSLLLESHLSLARPSKGKGRPSLFLAVVCSSFRPCVVLVIRAIQPLCALVHFLGLFPLQPFRVFFSQSFHGLPTRRLDT